MKKKQETKLRRIISFLSQVFVSALLMVIAGYNVYIFSNVHFKLGSQVAYYILAGNFLILAIFIYNYFKVFELYEGEDNNERH